MILHIRKLTCSNNLSNAYWKQMGLNSHCRWSGKLAIDKAGKNITKARRTHGAINWNITIKTAYNVGRTSAIKENKTILEIWGKAQRESARRCKSNWGKFMESWNSPGSKCITIRRTHNIRHVISGVSGWKFSNFFIQRGKDGAW